MAVTRMMKKMSLAQRIAAVAIFGSIFTAGFLLPRAHSQLFSGPTSYWGPYKKAVVTTPVFTTLTVATSTTAGVYVALPSQPATGIAVVNNTATSIEVQKFATGGTYTVLSGTSMSFTGITNASQITVRRTDLSTTSVTVTAESVFNEDVDGIANPSNTVQAYSLDKIRSTYTGPAIQVRRTSDGLLQNIAFNTVTDNLDTVALLQFCGAACTVATWYDQTGWGRDVTQATTANQPSIVVGGRVRLMEGRPALFFDGSNDALTNAGLGGVRVWIKP